MPRCTEEKVKEPTGMLVKSLTPKNIQTSGTNRRFPLHPPPPFTEKRRTLRASATIDAKQLYPSNSVLFSVRVLARKNYIRKKGIKYRQSF